MTKKVITTCDKCQKEFEESECRHFSKEDWIEVTMPKQLKSKVVFDLCTDCMAECLDIVFKTYSADYLPQKFGLEI